MKARQLVTPESENERLRTALAAAEARELALREALTSAIPWLDVDHATDEDSCAACRRVRAMDAALSAPRDTAALDAMLAKARLAGAQATLPTLSSDASDALAEHDAKVLAAERLKTAAAQQAHLDDKIQFHRTMSAQCRVAAAAQARVGELRRLAEAVMAEHDEETTGSTSLDNFINAAMKDSDPGALREFGLKVAAATYAEANSGGHRRRRAAWGGQRRADAALAASGATPSYTVPALPVDDAAEARYVALLNEKRGAASMHEHEFKSCASCGLDEIECWSDGLVWTCTECVPCPNCGSKRKRALAAPTCATCFGAGYIAEDHRDNAEAVPCPDCGGKERRCTCRWDTKALGHAMECRALAARDGETKR